MCLKKPSSFQIFQTQINRSVQSHQTYWYWTHNDMEMVKYYWFTSDTQLDSANNSSHVLKYCKSIRNTASWESDEPRISISSFRCFKKKNQDQLTITWCRLFCGLRFPLRWNTCCVYIRYTTRSHLKKPEEFCVVFFTVHLVCKSLQVPVFFAPIGSSRQSWKELDFVPAHFILLAVISTDCLLPMLMLI